MKLREVGEFGLIARLKQQVAETAEGLIVGIDDDAAVIQPTPGLSTVVSTDTFVEGIHFDLSYFSFRDVGWRLMAANLSDMAAMAAVPRFVVLAIAIPEHIEVESVEELYAGAQELASVHRTVIIGGDTTKSPDSLFACMTILGEGPGSTLCLRSGARSGDAIMVTGSPGAASAGLAVLRSQASLPTADLGPVVQRHLRPTPRVAEAQFLSRQFDIHAMIDVSDGVASEIHHICECSTTGARLVAADLHIDSATRAAASLVGQPELDFALHGGEDFELLFTAPKQQIPEIQKELNARFALDATCIGEIAHKSHGVKMQHEDGRISDLPARGFDHFISE